MVGEAFLARRHARESLRDAPQPSIACKMLEIHLGIWIQRMTNARFAARRDVGGGEQRLRCGFVAQTDIFQVIVNFNESLLTRSAAASKSGEDRAVDG
jgi:hypothetical protein